MLLLYGILMQRKKMKHAYGFVRADYAETNIQSYIFAITSHTFGLETVHYL